MGRVFISHAHADAEIIHSEILDVLKRANIDYFCSSEGQGLRGGQELNDALNNALDSMEWFVVVVSRHSIQSEYVKGEVGVALDDLKDRIVPVVIDDTQIRRIDIRLKSKLFVDWNSEDAPEQLVRALQPAGSPTPRKALSDSHVPPPPSPARASAPPPPPPAGRWHVYGGAITDHTASWTFSEALQLVKENLSANPMVMEDDPAAHAAGWKKWEEIISFRMAIETSRAPGSMPPPPVQTPDVPKISQHQIKRLGREMDHFAHQVADHLAAIAFVPILNRVTRFDEEEALDDKFRSLALDAVSEEFGDALKAVKRTAYDYAVTCLRPTPGRPGGGLSGAQRTLPKSLERRLKKTMDAIHTAGVGDDWCDAFVRLETETDELLEAIDDDGGLFGGAGLGTAIGFALGGPIGAGIGALIGGGAGSLADGGVSDESLEGWQESWLLFLKTSHEWAEVMELCWLEFFNEVLESWRKALIAGSDPSEVDEAIAYLESEIEFLSDQ